MAFQRPFLISLKRSDASQKWGFSIQGGSDRCEPLTVQQVAEGSLSERCGLRQGDELIQVGRVNVQDLPIGQVYELLARCGNKIEMFVVREDLLTPRKGQEPPVVKAVVHNPYNSPLSLYSAENVADTLGKQAEVLTEGHVSTEEDEGPENLSFKQKSAVFQLLEEQSKQGTQQESAPYSRVVQQSTAVKKPKSAPPPPPPKPKPPVQENLHNGYSHPQETQQYSTQYQRGLNQYEQQYNQSPLRENVNYQQLPGGYQVTYQNSYQTSSSPGSPVVNTQQYPGSYQSQVTYQSKYQTTQGSHSPVTTGQQPQFPSHVTTLKESHRSTSHQQSAQQQYTSGYQQPQRQLQQQPSAVHQQSYQQQSVAYQQPSAVNQQTSVAHQQPKSPGGIAQQTNAYQQQQVNYQQQQQRREQERPQQQQQSVSKAEFKIGPPPPARSSSNKQQQQHQNQRDSNMTAIYKQQYEQHLQKQYEQEQMHLNQLNHDDASKPRAHIIEGEIFEHNSSSGTPISYKTPPAAPPKPVWPPPERSTDNFRGAQPASPSGMDITAAWPPKKSSAVELPRTGFNPAAVREQGTGRRCVWPPTEYEFHSGRNTPQSPITGRRIQWNPSPSPPSQRRTLVSPARRKDIQWPPPSPTGQNNGFDKENLYRNSPRLSRKAQFDDYIHEHASINVPQTYRPPPGTQHVEFH